MTRARAVFAAVPQRVWTAVAGLALLASLAIAAVIGAGLSLWRSAVGSSARPPVAAIEPPGSGIVVLPGGHAPRVPSPLNHTPTARSAPPHVPAALGPVVSGPAAPATPVAVTSVPSTPVTSVAFTPRLLAADGNGAGLLAARIEQIVDGQPDAHVRHEATVAQREATRHHAKHEVKHAKSGRAHHAKHGTHRYGR